MRVPRHGNELRDSPRRAHVLAVAPSPFFDPASSGHSRLRCGRPAATVVASRPVRTARYL